MEQDITIDDGLILCSEMWNWWNGIAEKKLKLLCFEVKVAKLKFNNYVYQTLQN